MKVTFLGTNGWYDTPTGNTVCVLVESEEFDIVLDAGNGIAKLDRFITQEKPVLLFLSHFHIDHIAGLHALVKFRFKQGLTIFCRPGGTRHLNTFVNEPFTVPLDRQPYPVTVTELAEGVHSVPFRVEVRPLVHPDPCSGYRLEVDNKIIAYCTDTGVCDNAVRLAKDADLLIAECALQPGQTSPEWPHLNPEDAIGIARKAGARRLALVHFDAAAYPTIEARRAVSDQFAKDCTGLVVAEDDQTIDI